MSDKTRAEFEYWASDDGENPAAVERSGNGYKLAQIQTYWQAWLAARERYEPRWRPIETAPKDGTWILAVNAETNPGRQHVVRRPTGCSVLSPWKTGSGFLDSVDRLTHWMPLPLPPSTQGGGE